MQRVTSEVRVLGGVSQKVLLPSVLQSLSTFLNACGLDFPPGPYTTVYRAEVRGVEYYSRAYQRVKKRNSYTISYSDNGTKKFAFIEYFVHLQQRVIAVLKPLSPLQVTCKDHFGLTTAVLDSSVFITPVNIENTIEICFAEDISAKCLFLDFQVGCTHYAYVAQFPSTISFD